MDIISDYINKLILFKIEVEKELGFKTQPSKMKFESSSYDVAILTASQEEFNCVKNTLEEVHEIECNKDDSTIYYCGNVKSKNVILSVILPVPNNIGIESTIITTTKLLSNFSIRYVFMVGITAGNKKVTKIGDIIVAEKSLNYSQVVEIQKEDKEKREKYMQSVVSIHSYMKNRFDLFANSLDLEEIFNSYKHKEKIKHDLKYHVGLLVTGSSLLRSDDKISKITQTYHGVKGLDMETSGFYYALANVPKNKSPYFASIKSVSDFGDNTKHELSAKERKEYALFTSSTALIKFIQLYVK